MDSSVAELRAPLDDGPVADLLRRRARELARLGGAEIIVRGELPALPPVLAAHAYRIAAEALTNAVRHAAAERVDVVLDARADPPTIVVRDDGTGLPPELRPGSHGLRFMRARAETIGGRLDIVFEVDRGTVVTLTVPGTRSDGDQLR